MARINLKDFFILHPRLWRAGCDRSDRWSAAHVSDTAHLFRLALENDVAGARYHATAEEGIEFRQIAQIVGERLGLPIVSVAKDDTSGHFGWLSAFVEKDMSAKSMATRDRLKWHPTGPGLLASLGAISPK